jgi:hypothetical protein
MRTSTPECIVNLGYMMQMSVLIVRNLTSYFNVTVPNDGNVSPSR